MAKTADFTKHYTKLGPSIFPEEWLGAQMVVPFLGAGASLPAPSVDAEDQGIVFPDRAKIEEVLATLGFGAVDGVVAGNSEHKQARLILQFALALAYLMIDKSERVNSAASKSVLEELRSDKFPPTASRLVDAFASRKPGVPHEVTSLMKAWPKNWRELGKGSKRKEWVQGLKQTFRLLIDAASLWRANESLTSIAADFETRNKRTGLWEYLHQIFGGKTTPTDTHLLVSRAARHHLSLAKRRVDEARANGDDYRALLPDMHYLIVTTNYDCLIEEALGDDVPWMVLYGARPQKKAAATASHVLVRCSNALIASNEEVKSDHANQLPEEFSLNKISDPIVVIFKIHGSIQREHTVAQDSVVITDFDYEDYLSSMGENAQRFVPRAAGKLLHNRSFLFLGYSLNDWNVRTILTALLRKRDEGQGDDYAVMKEVSTSAEAYCQRWKIKVLGTTLDDFGKEVSRYAPKSGTDRTVRSLS